MRSREEIAERANELLEEAKISVPPVSVARIAGLLGVSILREPLAGTLSGMLVGDGKCWVIGVNSLHSATRQRFTVAHELGHLVLHREELSTRAPHIDEQKNLSVLFRNPDSALGISQSEVEANRFAAELLMPTSLLVNDMTSELVSLIDDEEQLIEQLARRYRVSAQAMAIRLNQLKF